MAANPKLRGAEISDLVEGNIIYVRGHRAVCKRLEFPLVYYQFDGQNVEKHQSYNANKAIFQVVDGDVPERGGKHQGTEGVINKMMLKAAFEQDWERVFDSLEKGADVNAQDEDGDRLLHFSASKGQLEATKKLIQLGANVNATDDDGWTALHHATMFGYSKVLEVLLANGADINIRNDDGKTVLDMAETEDVPKFCLEVLRKHANGGDAGSSESKESHASAGAAAPSSDGAAVAAAEAAKSDSAASASVNTAAAHGAEETAI